MAGKKTKADGKETTKDYIDLSLRIRNDGGSVYQMLKSIPDPYARGDRVRQLICIGLLVEQGRLPGQFASNLTVVPQGNNPEPQSTVPDKSPQQLVQTAAANIGDEEIKFDPSDLFELFGKLPTDVNLGGLDP